MGKRCRMVVAIFLVVNHMGVSCHTLAPLLLILWLGKFFMLQSVSFPAYHLVELYCVQRPPSLFLKGINVGVFNLLWRGVECREQVSTEVPASGFNCLRLGVFFVRWLLLGHNAVGAPFVNAILPQSQNLFACDCGPFTLIKWLRQRIERNAPRFRTSDRYWLRNSFYGLPAFFTNASAKSDFFNIVKFSFIVI